MKKLLLILLLLLLLVSSVSADTVISFANYDSSIIDGTNSNWLVLRNDTGESVTNLPALSCNAGYTTSSTTDPQMNYHYRCGVSFPLNASFVPGSTIDSVTASVKGKIKANSLGTAKFGVMNFTPAAISFVGSDYSKTKFIRLAPDIEYASFSNSGWNTLTLNTEGISRVSKTGNTTLFFTHSYDIDFTNFTWASAVSSGFQISSVTESAGVNRPYLTITFTPAAAPDTTPPDSITELTNTTATNCSSINWTWTNPTDADFNHTYVMRNNVFYDNLSNTTTYSLWTGLTASTLYEIATHTVDITGNMNTTWVNASYTLPACGVAPVSAFSANNLTICQGTDTQFTDASTNTPTSWYWMFGDGNTSTTQNPLKIYDVVGLMNVYLNASNTYGFDWENKTAYINVTACAAPIPTPTPTPTPTTPPPTTTVPTPTPAPVGCVFTNISGITVDVNNTNWAVTSGGTTWGVMNISNTSISYYRCGNAKLTTGGSLPSYVNTPLSPLLGLLAVMGIAFIIIRKK